MGGISQVGERSHDVHSNTVTIQESTGKIVDVSKEMLDIIETNAVKSFVASAKQDHLAWKLSLYRAILDNDSAVQLDDEHSCRFGRSLNEGMSSEFFKGVSSYSQVQKTHSQFHALGKDVVSFIGGDRSRLSGAIDKMERASNDLVNKLDALAREASK